MERVGRARTRATMVLLAAACAVLLLFEHSAIWGGDGFEVGERVGADGVTYAALRVGMGALDMPFVMHVFEVRPLLPGVQWWRHLHGPVLALDARLELTADQLLVHIEAHSPQPVIRVPLR